MARNWGIHGRLTHCSEQSFKIPLDVHELDDHEHLREITITKLTTTEPTFSGYGDIMKTLFATLICMAFNLPALAEEGMTNHAQSLSVINDDTRQLVNYPPEVRAHALANMRGHLKALADIMDAVANARYAEAADIADNRLGMNSAGAAGCQPKDMKMTQMSKTSHLDHQMQQLMPEEMRVLGQNMHRAANEFSVKARDADKNILYITEANLALAKIARQCVACHENFRMQ